MYSVDSNGVPIQVYHSTLMARKKLNEDNIKKLVTSLKKNHRPLAGTPNWNQLTDLQRTRSMTRAVSGSKRDKNVKSDGKLKSTKSNAQVMNRPFTSQDPTCSKATNSSASTSKSDCKEDVESTKGVLSIEQPTNESSSEEYEETN